MLFLTVVDPAVFLRATALGAVGLLAAVLFAVGFAADLAFAVTTFLDDAFLDDAAGAFLAVVLVAFARVVEVLRVDFAAEALAAFFAADAVFAREVVLLVAFVTRLAAGLAVAFLATDFTADLALEAVALVVRFAGAFAFGAAFVALRGVVREELDTET